jgi:hypothetical protein
MNKQESIQITPENGDAFNFIPEDKATTSKHSMPQEIALSKVKFSVGKNTIYMHSQSKIKAAMACDTFNYSISYVQILRHSNSTGRPKCEEYMGLSVLNPPEGDIVILLVNNDKKEQLVASLFCHFRINTIDDFYNILLQNHTLPYLVDLQDERIYNGNPYCPMYSLEAPKPNFPMPMI